MFHCLCIGWSTLFYWKSYQVRTYMYATCEYAVTDWWFNLCETSTPHPSGYPGIWNLNFLRLACPNSKLCSNAPPNFFVKGKISNYDFLDIDQDLKPSLFQLKLPTPARQGSNSPPLNTHADDSQKPVGCLRGGDVETLNWLADYKDYRKNDKYHLEIFDYIHLKSLNCIIHSADSGKIFGVSAEPQLSPTKIFSFAWNLMDMFCNGYLY